MTSTPWLSFHMIWLSIFMTVAQPAWALNPRDMVRNDKTEQCIKLLKSEGAASLSISELVEKKDLTIESSVFPKQRKPVVLAREDSIRGENTKHLFILALRLDSDEEGLQFFNQLVSRSNLLNGTRWAAVVKSEKKFLVPGVCAAEVHSPFYARHIPVAYGSQEIEITIDRSADEVTVATQIAAVLLNDFKLKFSPPPSLEHLATYDLTTQDGRWAWMYEASYDWVRSLSPDAKAAMKLISGGAYLDILPFLRGRGRNGAASVPTEKLQVLISELDDAIERGKIPVAVKLYRASSDSATVAAWTKLSENSEAAVEPLSDKAYTFTSLDEQFVRMWNIGKLRGKGIILEIEASAGVRAGYVDRGPQQRDYAEIILARRQGMTPVRAYTNAIGEKHLVVTVP